MNTCTVILPYVSTSTHTTKTTDLRRRVDGELEFRLLSVVDRESLHEQRREARARAAAETVEDEEPLQPGTLVRLQEATMMNRLSIS